MKKCNCPKCGKELIDLTPMHNWVSYFWCDECDIDIRITSTSSMSLEGKEDGISEEM